MNEKVNELIKQLPDPDDRGLMSQIDKQVVDEVTAGILAGGADSISAVVDMLTEPGKGDDYKAHYALHCVAIGIGQDQEKRPMVAQAIAGCLEKEYPKGVKQYLIQELQVVGGREVVETLGKFLHDEALCEPAAMALMAIRWGAQAQFENALDGADDKCRPTIQQNLELAQRRRRRRQ
ncbi:MAG: hypothetical protein JW828_14655 [Sedimentisphaerales bacterium]|nr:hypothetical protein [Sedimentisphaerales bacterium]